MNYKSLILIALGLFINNSNCLEFRQFTYLNTDCSDLPTATYASTECSPESYFVLNGSYIHSMGVSSRDECALTDDGNTRGDLLKIGTCYTENGEIVYESSISGDDSQNHSGSENSGNSYSYSNYYSYSMKMEYVGERLPVLVDNKDYCNQISLFDCNNYQIYSFKNNSCFTNSDSSSGTLPFLKQVCSGENILTYYCRDYCEDENDNCSLEKIEKSNLGVCPNIKSLSLESMLNLKSNKKIIVTKMDNNNENNNNNNNNNNINNNENKQDPISTKQGIVEKIKDKDFPKNDIDGDDDNLKKENNSNNGFEVHLIKYKNILCKNDPIFIIASTNCSNIGYFQKGASSSLGITQVNSIEDCSADKRITKFVNTKQCYLNQDGTSYQYIINDFDTPRSVDTYCNEFTLFDCNNYFVNSFRNGTCNKNFKNNNNNSSSNETSSILFSNNNTLINDNNNNGGNQDIIYKKKECVNDIINIYECSSKNCNDSCILKQSYSSNFSKCTNFQALKVFSFLGNPKSTNETSDELYFNGSNYSFDDNDSLSIKLLPNFYLILLLLSSSIINLKYFK